MKDNILKEIGERLVSARKAKGYKQEQLAALTGLSPKTISAAENGHKALRPENMIKICDALSITADYLLYGESPHLNALVEHKQIEQLTPKQKEALSKIIQNFLSIFED